MKNFCIIIIVIFMLANFSKLFGQQALSSDSFSLTGSIQYFSNSYTQNNFNYKEDYMIINPQLLYFMANHFSIGGFINYNKYDNSVNINYNLVNNYRSIYLSIGPLIRYYFDIEKFIPFVEGSLILNLQESNPIELGVKGGADYFLSRSVALEPSVAYYFSINIFSQGRPSNQGLTIFTIGIGINYFIF